jgi:hypothetical protein
MILNFVAGGNCYRRSFPDPRPFPFTPSRYVSYRGSLGRGHAFQTPRAYPMIGVSRNSPRVTGNSDPIVRHPSDH